MYVVLLSYPNNQYNNIVCYKSEYVLFLLTTLLLQFYIVLCVFTQGKKIHYHKGETKMKSFCIFFISLPCHVFYR